MGKSKKCFRRKTISNQIGSISEVARMLIFRYAVDVENEDVIHVSNLYIKKELEDISLIDISVYVEAGTKYKFFSVVFDWRKNKTVISQAIIMPLKTKTVREFSEEELDKFIHEYMGKEWNYVDKKHNVKADGG